MYININKNILRLYFTLFFNLFYLFFRLVNQNKFKILKILHLSLLLDCRRSNDDEQKSKKPFIPFVV